MQRCRSIHATRNGWRRWWSLSSVVTSSGCWFRMKDDVGEVFVDLAPAKLRLTEKREGQHAKVTGRVVKLGGQFRLEAQYVEFTPAEKNAPASAK